MKILVLGSGASAGLPRWHCACGRCAADPGRPLRTLGSLAVSADGRRWVLLHASPDLGAQLRSTPQLHRRADEPGPFAAVVLLDAQVDHVAGLLGLRDGPAIDLHATPSVFESLHTQLPLLPVLGGHCGVRWHMIGIDAELPVAEFRVDAAGALRFTAIACDGDGDAGARIALHVEDLRDGRRLFYAPGREAPGSLARRWMSGADCVMLGSGFWDDATAAPLAAHRKLLVHLNDCDPALDRDSAQRRRLDAHGVELAFDGMEIEL